MALRRLATVLACGLVAGAAVWVVTQAIPPKYEAQAQISYQFPQIATATRAALALGTPPGATGSPDALLPSEAIRRAAARQAARRLGEPDQQRIAGQVDLRILRGPPSVPQRSNASTIEVRASSRSAARARELASSFAAAYVGYRRATLTARFAELREILGLQRAVADAADRATIARLHRDRAVAKQLGTLEQDNASAARHGVPVAMKAGPHPWRDGGVAALIGTLLALLVKPRRTGSVLTVHRVAAGALTVGALLLASNAVKGTSYDLPARSHRPSDAVAGLHTAALPDRRRAESDLAFFQRVADFVRRRMAYGWDYRQQRVAWTDNWLLSLAGRVRYSYAAYEFVDPHRGLRRGFGLCSQYVNIAFAILRRNGYRPRNVLFPDHNVMAVRTRAGREAVVDPTFGVVIAKPIDTVRRNPRIIDAAYGHVSAQRSPVRGYTGTRLVRTMRRAYAKQIGVINTGRATPQTAVIEPIAYAAKWVIPAVLCAGGALALVALRRRRRPAGRGSRAA